jgi:hypothetical protein
VGCAGTRLFRSLSARRAGLQGTPAGRAGEREGLPCGSPIARRPDPGQAPGIKDSQAWPCYFFAS